jgi:hypothetical protein
MSLAEDELLEQLRTSLEACGLRHIPSASGFAVKGADGFERCFWTEESIYPSVGNCHVVFAHSRKVQFRPWDLGSHRDDYQVTQAEYDLVKNVFDTTGSIECFGFHASQDNAVVFRDSELSFFFSKSGPQLVLKHLEERRNLDPDEECLEFEGNRELHLYCSSRLHSVFFTQFSAEYYDGMHVPYSSLQALIERPWRDYFPG